jgi:hypothetical protein
MNECRDNLDNGIFNAVETVVRKCVAPQLGSSGQRAGNWEEIFSRTHQTGFELLRERGVARRAWIRRMRYDRNGDRQPGDVVQRRGRQYRRTATLDDRLGEDNAVRAIRICD